MTNQKKEKIFVVQTTGEVSKPVGLRQMLALLKTAGSHCQLFMVKEELSGCLKRLIVCHFRIEAEIKPANWCRSVSISDVFEWPSVVDFFRYLTNPAAAVAQYRQMLLSAIEAANAANEPIELFHMNTVWPESLVTTELVQAGDIWAYVTNDGMCCCESKSVLQAVLAHRRFEDRSLVID